MAEATETISVRHEAGLHVESHQREHEAHQSIHAEEHIRASEARRLEEGRIDDAFAGHMREHAAGAEAIKTALAAVKETSEFHSVSHAREHASHEVRHEDGRIAMAKADGAMDKRLEALNGVYGQMREQQRAFASSESVTTLTGVIDRRFEEARRDRESRHEELRVRIESIEKGDVKQEGKSLGQGALVAIIVGAVAFVGTVLSIVSALANVATG